MRVLIVEDEVKMAGLIRRGLRARGDRRRRRDQGRGRALDGRGDRLRRDRARRDAAGHRRLRGLPAAARRRGLVADPDADRARRRPRPGRRPRRRRRRLPDQAVLLRRAARPAAGAGPPRRGRAPGRSCGSATCASTRRPGGSGAARPRSTLSAKEFAILETFMRRPGEVLSRFQLLEHAWDYDYENRSNVVDSYVRFLREQDRQAVRGRVDRDRARRRLPAARGRRRDEPDADPAAGHAGVRRR